MTPLADRLRHLGLRKVTRVELHRNRVVLLTLHRGVLRIHQGYADAPDDVLADIVKFLSAFTRRRERLAARKRFLAYPLDHAEQPHRRPPRPQPGDRPWIERIRLAHAQLNARHFAGALAEIPIRLSGRMRRRLGQVTLSRETGAAVEMGFNRRHVQHDPWPEVEDTLLHEMVHQWQAETGQPVDHGAGFRQKARAVGIHARACRPAS